MVIESRTGPLGVTVIGPGKWARQLAAAANRSSSLKLISCYGRSEEGREEFGAEFGCVPCGSADEALSLPEVEAALVTTPSLNHREITDVCVSHGRHVFVEKPIANSVSGAQAMIESCRRENLVLMVGHEMRRLGSSRAIKRLIDSGVLGRVLTASADFSLRGLFWPENWRTDKSTNPGGALMQLGIHHIETLVHLLGPVVEVQGSLAHVAAPGDFDDVGFARLTFENGALATVTANYLSPPNYEISLRGEQANVTCVLDMTSWPDAYQVDRRTRLELSSRYRRDAIDFKPHDVLVEELVELGRCVREGTIPETGGDEGLKALAIVEAAILSSDLGRTVDPRTIS